MPQVFIKGQALPKHESAPRILGFSRHFRTLNIIYITVNTALKGFGVNTMLLLTNCEVHTGKYSDRSFEIWTEVRRKKYGLNIFRYGPN